MAIIAVFNLQPGTGKTTTAISLAEALGRFGARVLLVDLTPDHDATVAVQGAHTIGLAETLAGDLPLRSCIGRTTMTGVDLLSLPDIPLQALFGSTHPGRERLQDLIRRASEGYTYVVIDLPDRTGDITGAALRVADVALVPIPAEEDSLADAARMVRGLEDLRQRESLRLRIALLLTMVSSTPASARVAAALRSAYPRFMLPTAIPLDDTLPRRLDRLPSGRIPSSGEDAYQRVAIDLSRRLSSLAEPAQAHA